VIAVDTDSAQYSQDAFSRITRVQLQAAATGVHGEMQMRSISAAFAAADGSTETVVVPDSSAPAGNNSTGSGTAAQAIQITPFSANYDSVIVNMQVRLSSPQTTLPAPDSLRGGIYVFAA